MQDILKRVQEEELFDKMDIEDIEFLINNSTGIIKFMFILMKNKKLLEINTDNLVEHKDNSSTKIKTKRKVNNHKNNWNV